MAFLNSLTDTAFVSNPAFGDPGKNSHFGRRAGAGLQPAQAWAEARHPIYNSEHAEDDVRETFQTLRSILERNRGQMKVMADTDTEFSLASPP